MKWLFASIITLALCACSAKVIPLKGSYPSPPITFATNNKTEQVWSNIIDFISTTGMSIKVIDKSSGLIITDDYSFMDNVTFENYKTKKVKNPNAYLVSSWLSFGNGLNVTPTELTANWNIRIKEDPKGTSVAVNITNVKAKAGESYVRFDVRSTGVFEKMIFEIVK